MNKLAPAEFTEALATLRKVRTGSGVDLVEIPGPSKLAPYVAALSATQHYEDSESSARLVILYDPACPAAWEGPFRLVLMVRADIEEDIAADPLFSEVAWAWLGEAFETCEAGYSALAGTVTRTLSHSFGGLVLRGSETGLEIRASWSPTDNDLAPHLYSVLHLLSRLTFEGSADFFGQDD